MMMVQLPRARMAWCAGENPPGNPVPVRTSSACRTDRGWAAQMGITLVGLSSVLSGEGSQTHLVSVPQMLLGMGLIIASQARSLLNFQMLMQGLGPLCNVVMFHAMFVLSHTALSTTWGGFDIQQLPVSKS